MTPYDGAVFRISDVIVLAVEGTIVDVTRSRVLSSWTAISTDRPREIDAFAVARKRRDRRK